MKATLGKLILVFTVSVQSTTMAFKPSALLHRGVVSGPKTICFVPDLESHHRNSCPRQISPWAFAYTAPTRDRTRSRLFASVPDPDLIVGYFMIAAASTPYVLSLFFPNFFLKNFFLPVYKDDKDGRDAEIAWKTRYATLGLVLTTLVGLEVWLAPTRIMSGFAVLRDVYIAWTAFYTDAFLKIRREAKEGIIGENIVGIQTWHFLVAFVLWADVSQSPLAKAVIEWIMKKIFHGA